MATSVRSFSLSLQVQTRLDKLLSGPGRTLLTTHLLPAEPLQGPTLVTVPELDGMGLLPEEYAPLCLLAGMPKTAKPPKTEAELRAVLSKYVSPEGLPYFNKVLRGAQMRCRAVVRDAVKRNGVLTKQHERYTARYAAHPPSASQSRVVDALLTLGMDTLEKMGASEKAKKTTLEERAASRATEKHSGSQSGHAGQVAHKSSNSKARSAAKA